MAVCAHENLNLIALGFKDGTAIILKGNITRDRQSRQRIVHKEEEQGIYITGMYYIYLSIYSSIYLSIYLLIYEGLAFRQVGVNPVLMLSTNQAVYSCFLGDQPKKVWSY